jgi:cardiolipin synthase
MVERRRERYASRSRLLAGTAGLGATVGAALTRHRPLGSAESGVLAAAGIAVALLALVGLLAPRLVAYPLALIGLGLGYTLLARAWRTRRRTRR